MEFDDIRPVLNPVQIADLETILHLTPEHLRVELALLWAGLSRRTWITLALGTSDGAAQTTISRWLGGEHQMPLGAAYRLSAVVGMSPSVLFAELIRRKESAWTLKHAKHDFNKKTAA